MLRRQSSDLNWSSHEPCHFTKRRSVHAPPEALIAIVLFSFAHDEMTRPVSMTPGSTAIEAFINMARSLHLRVIAQGVETADDLEFLWPHECDEAQGNFFSRPVPPDQLAKLLRAELSLQGFCHPLGNEVLMQCSALFISSKRIRRSFLSRYRHSNSCWTRSELFPLHQRRAAVFLLADILVQAHPVSLDRNRM